MIVNILMMICKLPAIFSGSIPGVETFPHSVRMPSASPGLSLVFLHGPEKQPH